MSAAALPAAAAQAAGTQTIDRSITVCGFPYASPGFNNGIRLRIKATAPETVLPGETVQLSDVTATIKLNGVKPPPIYPDPATSVSGTVTSLELTAKGATTAAAPVPGEFSFGPSPGTDYTGRMAETPLTTVGGAAPALPAFTAAGGEAPIVIDIGRVSATWKDVLSEPLTRVDCTPLPGQLPLVAVGNGRPAPGAPVVTSLSPTAGNSVYGSPGTLVTIKGSNLATLRGADFSEQRSDFNDPVFGTSLTVIDDTTATVIAPSRYEGKANVQLVSDFGISADTPADDFTYREDVGDRVPRVTEIVPAAGERGATITLRGVNLDLAGGLLFQDPSAATYVERRIVSPTEMTLKVPARRDGSAPSPANIVTSLRITYRGGTEQTLPFTILADAAAQQSFSLGLAGAATLKTLTKGSVPLTGGLAGSVDTATNALTADLTLAKTSASLVALGFLPVSAQIAFTPTEPVTGTLIGGALKASAKVRIKLPRVSLLGVGIGGGANCQTKQLSTVPLSSTGPGFNLATGGQLAGTFVISDLAGCGSLNGLISPLTAGKGNAIALNLAPQA